MINRAEQIVSDYSMGCIYTSVMDNRGSQAECGDVACIGGSRAFWLFKRLFDILLSIAMIPFVFVTAIFVLVMNIRGNPGPLFYVQDRMGLDGTVIRVIKFRTMLAADSIQRGPDDPLEHDRITPFGKWMRSHRVDELPQIWNVLIGQMSFIGPRPDYIDHARRFAEIIPGYRNRHVIRPGISGYAQVRLGYAEGSNMAARKTRLDHVYIRKAGWRVELSILLRTFLVIRNGFGAS